MNQLLENGQNAERQRQALELLAEASREEPMRGQLRADLDRLIAAKPPHPVLESLWYYRAQLALDMFTSEIRRYLGGLLVELGGVDVVVFTGGIGENGVRVRADVCAGLKELGIVLDSRANESARGEVKIHAAESRAQIWVVPTNEELVVARQAKRLLEGS